MFLFFVVVVARNKKIAVKESAAQKTIEKKKAIKGMHTSNCMKEDKERRRKANNCARPKCAYTGLSMDRTR